MKVQSPLYWGRELRAKLQYSPTSARHGVVGRTIDRCIIRIYIGKKTQTLNLRTCALVEGFLDTKSTICRDTDSYEDNPSTARALLGF